MTKNKIDARLEQCKAEGRKALITFITAGDGGYDCTEKAVLEMAKNGADLIELGVPFSDPIAEGPVIQCASERSLRNGTTLVGTPSAERNRCAAAVDDVPEHHFPFRNGPLFRTL